MKPYSNVATRRESARRVAALLLTAVGLAIHPMDSSFASEPRAPLSSPELHNEFDVVIVGGSTAALAAAIAASDEGARVALLEPTDWPGGQLTASGVPAVDEAWHKIVDPQSKAVLLDVAAMARDPRNMTPLFRDMLLRTGNPGRGWVSRFCFEPKKFLAAEIEPQLAARKDRLTIFRQTVVKQVEADPRRGVIRSIIAIQRIPDKSLAAHGYDVLPSRDLVDWYDPRPSKRFKKQILRFAAKPQANGQTVFIDATEWGEVLVLARAPYLQGVEPTDGALKGSDRCGQSTVFGFVEELHKSKVDEPPINLNADRFGFGDYADRDDAWQQIWTYRRIKASGDEPRPGDLSLQNWGYSERLANGGNDYPFGYLFKSKQGAAAERPDWHGGVDLAVMAAAEQRALGWHEWFKAHAPQPFAPGQITLAPGALGTGHGLSKLPYIRDTRRSIGLDGFVLKFADLTGPAAQQTGTKFPDRIAIGAYPADVHRLADCDYPPFIAAAHDTLPFYIPLRALTNRRYGNLLVAGKTMAQTFFANSATRLHPVEWSTGAAAGVAAAQMAKKGWTTRQLLEHVSDLQPLVAKRTPIDWTIADAPPASK